MCSMGKHETLARVRRAPNGQLYNTQFERVRRVRRLSLARPTTPTCAELEGNGWI